MTLTKRQKFLGVVMLGAAGAFAWDRMHDEPAPADAANSASSLLISPSDSASVPKPSAPIASAAVTPASPTKMPISASTLGDILQNIAAAQKIDCQKPGDGFSLPDAWQAARAASPSPVPAANLDRERAQQFAAKHHLDAVMVGSAHGGYAIIDGVGVDVNRSLDGFTLLSVDANSATFARGRIRLQLRLPENSDVQRDGSVIENHVPVSKGE